jgi:hypothetical protein
MAAQKQARQIDRNIRKSFMTFDPLTCPGTCGNQLKARNQTYEALISKAASFMWGLFSCALLLALPVVISGCKQESPVLTNETLPDVPGIQTKADGGDSVAQFELGSAYAKGLVVTQSYAQAAHWYRLAAGQSNAAALLALGELSTPFSRGGRAGSFYPIRCYHRSQPEALFNLRFNSLVGLVHLLGVR